MSNNTENIWSISDNIEDIEADQPYGYMSMIEYGMSELESPLPDPTGESQYGYGRGIPIQAACSELAADIRKYGNVNQKMGEVLTTEDIVQLSLHDVDKVGAEPETVAMLRSVGINKYDDTKFTGYKNEDNYKILSQPIVNGNRFPILLDDSYHKFNIKPRISETPQTDAVECKADSSMPQKSATNNSSNSIVNSNKQTKTSVGNNGEPSIIGFSSVLCPNPNEKHNLRHKQPTIGIGKEVFIRPIDVYFQTKTKQSKTKKSPRNKQ